MGAKSRTTNIYVDGLNLFYGSLKDSPYRWLDLARLCQVVLTNNTINRIRYFTALVQSRPGHPQQQQNQQTYIRALETLPYLSVHYGRFLSSEPWMPCAIPPASGEQFVKVFKTEEKGSDVNIATYLLLDCFRNEFEAAIVISNDSDLVEPIRVVRKEFKRLVGVVSPYQEVSWALKKNATFYTSIEPHHLAASQFPSTLTDRHGQITKPPTW